MSAQVCTGCGTYFADHYVKVNKSEPWHSVDVSLQFLKALGERRLIQSIQILRVFKRALEAGRVLDYGCGQGILVNTLVSSGYQAMGCDLSREVTRDIDPKRFIGLGEPWALPEGFDFQTVILLDVLEHGSFPSRFVSELRGRGTRHILVKVPLATGPVFQWGKMLVRLGFPSVMEKLFLVGDVAPHRLYFTARGLIRLFEQEGYRMSCRLNMAEVGKELPRRIRQIPAFWKALSPLLSVAGYGAEQLSVLWPDTSVFQFDRRS